MSPFELATPVPVGKTKSRFSPGTTYNTLIYIIKNSITKPLTGKNMGESQEK